MTKPLICPICGLPDDEHYFDCAAFGCLAFDVTEGQPHRPVGRKSNFFVNGLIIAGVVGFLYLVWVFMS